MRDEGTETGHGVVGTEKCRTGGRRARRWTGLGVAAAAALLGADAAAAATEGCPTFFPDFRCVRQARPEGSVMPMSFPYLFEDPYITTGLNFVGIWHEFPRESAFQGGQVGVLALQARLAITEDVAFIATKDGFSFFDLNSKLPGTNTTVLDDEAGFFNIGLGFKAKVWEWQGDGRSAIVTPSLRYEIPVGARDVYQGHDDGILIPAVSAAYQDGGWHVIGGLGGQAGIDGDKTGSNVFYNLHVDHAFEVDHDVVRYVVPFIELSGIHYVDSGDGSRNISTELGSLELETATTALGLNTFEGADVANLGSRNMGGDDLVTMAWGVRVPLPYGLDFGVSYERPLSTREDIFEQRVTVMLGWEL